MGAWSKALAMARNDEINKRARGKPAVVFGSGPEDMLVVGEDDNVSERVRDILARPRKVAKRGT
jgi:hypothetical protein